MYGIFTALSFVALSIYLALPTRRLKNSVASSNPRLTLSMRNHLGTRRSESGKLIYQQSETKHEKWEISQWREISADN